MSSKQSLTITQALEDKHCKIIFWDNSTDVIILTESPYSYKGTARHITLGSVWDLVGSQCPRCDSEWKHSSNGIRDCVTRGCYTTKQSTGQLVLGGKPFKYQDSRANENVNIPPTESDIMSEPRDEEMFADDLGGGIIITNHIPVMNDETKTGGNKNE